MSSRMLGRSSAEAAITGMNIRSRPITPPTGRSVPASIDHSGTPVSHNVVPPRVSDILQWPLLPSCDSGLFPDNTQDHLQWPRGLITTSTPGETMTDPLAGHRARIDAIDEQILDLLRQRNDLAAEVIATKIDAGLPVFVPEREQAKVVAFRAAADAARPGSRLGRGLPAHDHERLARPAVDRRLSPPHGRPQNHSLGRRPRQAGLAVLPDVRRQRPRRFACSTRTTGTGPQSWPPGSTPPSSRCPSG